MDEARGRAEPIPFGRRVALLDLPGELAEGHFLLAAPGTSRVPVIPAVSGFLLFLMWTGGLGAISGGPTNSLVTGGVEARSKAEPFSAIQFNGKPEKQLTAIGTM